MLLNLCVNARDAMPDGGTLTLRASNLVLDETGASVETPCGRYVVLEVSDTGDGISEAICDQIFDPFFTTKEVGKGTGLGLSTAQAIVKKHRGSISLESQIGAGTTFRILLPATELEPAGAANVKHELPCGRGELVLVVDDEAGIRAVAQRTLEHFGYRVVAARNGSEGLTAFTRHEQEIAVVLTDIMMPVMDGPAMIHELRQLAPALPIIAVSGLSAPENLARVRAEGVQAFLSKPFTAETLLGAIAGALTVPPRPAADEIGSVTAP